MQPELRAATTASSTPPGARPLQVTRGVQSATRSCVRATCLGVSAIAFVTACATAQPPNVPVPDAGDRPRVVIAYVRPHATGGLHALRRQFEASVGHHADFDRGARLGISEARHAATLLRRDLEVLEISANSPESLSELLAAANVSVLISPMLSDVLASRVGLWATVPGRAIVTSAAGPRFACGMPIFRIAPDSVTRAAAAAQAGDSLPKGSNTAVVGTNVMRSRVATWHHGLARFGARQLNDRYLQRYERPMSSSAWEGWMAVKTAWESVLRARDGNVAAALGMGTFDGHKGTPLRFGAQDRMLRQPLVLVADSPELRRDFEWGIPSTPGALVREIDWPVGLTVQDSTASSSRRCP